MEKLLPIFKALSNPIRLQIYELLCKYLFITKSRIMNILKIGNRASLDHHLEVLREAKLLIEKPINFDNQRLVFVIVIGRLNIAQNFLIKYLDAVDNFEKIDDHLTYEELNKNLSRIKDRSIRIILRNALGNMVLDSGKTYRCELCQGNISNNAELICTNCGKFVCKSCSVTIKRPDQTTEKFCKKCETQFFFPKSSLF